MPVTFAVDTDILLRSFHPDDAPEMYALIASNRNRLDRWLRWSSSIQSTEDARKMIADFQGKETAGNGFHCGIWVERELAGGVVCWYIHPENRNCELGYWLGSDFTGRGFASRSTRTVMQYLFRERKLHRIEMQCWVENTASRAVAERCGLTEEGVRRESHWITRRFVDHVVYGMLEDEWAAHIVKQSE